MFFVQKNGTKLLDTLRTQSEVKREPFLSQIFLVLDIIFYRNSLELTKNYYQKLIAPNG